MSVASVTLILWLAALDPSVELQLKTEACRNWNESAQAIDGLEVELSRFKSVHPDPDAGEGAASEHSIRQWVAWAPQAARCLIETIGSASSERIVFNERYAFVVDQDQRQGDYQLSSCDQHGSNKPDIRSAALLTGSFGQIRSYLRSGFSLGSRPLPTLIEDQRFRLIVAETSANEKGEAIVKVEFAYEGQDPKIGIPGAHYWGELDPKNRWRVMQGGVRFKSQTRPGEIWETDSIEYREGDQDNPFPARLKRSLTYTNSPYTEKESVEFGVPSAIRRADTEFYLPYYGIPETVLQELTPRRGVRWWFIGLGIATLILGVILMRVNRRSNAKPGAS